MYTLYYAPRSAAMGVRVLLESIGAAYELSQVDIRSDEPRDPAFLRINPNGWVSDEHPAIAEFPNAARCVEMVAMRPEVARVFD